MPAYEYRVTWRPQLCSSVLHSEPSSQERAESLFSVLSVRGGLDVLRLERRLIAEWEPA